MRALKTTPRASVTFFGHQTPDDIHDFFFSFSFLFFCFFCFFFSAFFSASFFLLLFFCFFFFFSAFSAFLLLWLLHDTVRKRLGYFKRQVANMITRKREREREQERKSQPKKGASDKMEIYRKTESVQTHTDYDEKKHIFSCHISFLCEFPSFPFAFCFFPFLFLFDYIFV